MVVIGEPQWVSLSLETVGWLCVSATLSQGLPRAKSARSPPRETIYLLVSQGDTINHPSTRTIISEENAYCDPKRPAVYEIRYYVQGGKSFDCWLWQFDLGRQADSESWHIGPIVHLWVPEQPYLGGGQCELPHTRARK